MRFRHDVLVLDRHHRDVQTDHRASLAGVIAGGRNDVIAADVTLVGPDEPGTGRRLFDSQDVGIAIDRRATRACALCEGLGKVGGLDVTVLRMKDAADEAFDVA